MTGSNHYISHKQRIISSFLLLSHDAGKHLSLIFFSFLSSFRLDFRDFCRTKLLLLCRPSSPLSLVFVPVVDWSCVNFSTEARNRFRFCGSCFMWPFLFAMTCTMTPVTVNTNSIRAETLWPMVCHLAKIIKLFTKLVKCYFLPASVDIA